ncbi:outer membrane protein assembly factor [Luteolibacter sp. AS25]|uniref:BamA/OMP85 family outer membrane protein n=1 Tax=Luteolibacter sp. AS25 TaxID=3135776 RepID=UPI00398A5687
MITFLKDRVSVVRSAGMAVLFGVVPLSQAFAETTVDIRGMKSKSESDVLQLIGGRLVYIREKEANSWRANDAAFMVREILQNDGYHSAEVTAKVEGSNMIALIVSEGPRLSLGEVLIETDGDGDVESLHKTFVTPFGSTTPFGAGSAPFREEDVPKGLEFVTRQLMAEGYWSAEATLKKKNIDPETGEVDMSVSVKQGPRFKIRRPTVDSPDGRGVKRAATTWQPFLEEWATTENVNKLRAEMLEAFTSRGYPDVTVLMNNRLGYDSYFPDFTIMLGVRVKLVDIKVDGLSRTRPKRVKQIMEPLKEGWYDEAAMNSKVKELLATGAFRSVRIEKTEVAPKRINATLHFEEAKAKEVTFSAGADSFNGPLFRAGFTDRNFRGALRGFSAGMELSGRGILGEVRLTDPWWRGTDVQRGHRLYSLIKAYDGYTTYETGYESSWEYDVTEHYSMKLLGGLSFVTVAEEELPISLLGDTQYFHTWVKFTQSLDYRDSKILPKSGWHVDLPLQIGAAIGDDTNTYLKAGVDGGIYLPISDTWQLGIGGFAELVTTSGGIAQLPVDLRVFNGGARSVRSFPERELGPSFAGDPYGGDFSWAVNTEVSKSLKGPLRAVAFVDAGAVTGDYTGPRQGGLEIAAGLGVHIDLPIGPVRLEYGHNLTQDDAEPSGTWHFAIGTTF